MTYVSIHVSVLLSALVTLVFFFTYYASTLQLAVRVRAYQPLLHALCMLCAALHRCRSVPCSSSEDLFRVMTLSPRSYEHSIECV